MYAALHESDYKGKTFGHLTVLRKTGFKGGNGTYHWEFQCTCGSITRTRMDRVKSGHTQSCGCIKEDTSYKTSYKHGWATDKLNRVWRGIKDRCNNPKHRSYNNYGGRGIQICKEWAESFESFRDYMLALPRTNEYLSTRLSGRTKLSIDRKNNDGNYEPGNVRWATALEQSRNTRTYKRRSKTLASDWGSVDASGGFEDKKKITDLLPIVDKKDFQNTFKPYRFVGGVQAYQVIWLPIYNKGKPVLTKDKKPLRIPKYVTNFDLSTNKVNEDADPCPYVELAEKMNKHIDNDEDKIRIQQGYLACAIDREAQENPPRKVVLPSKSELKSGFYDIESKTTKMTVVFDMKPTLFRKIKGLKDLNKWKTKDGETKTYNVTDPDKGCDVEVKFSPKEKGGAMYDAQKSDKTPLTEEEQEYLLWDITGAIEPDSLDAARKEAARLWNEFKKSLKGKSSSDDDDDDMPDDLEEDDDDKPVKKKKNKKPIDDDEDDDGNDDEPIVKKGKKKKSVVDDDDDDDSSDDDDDKPVKKKKNKKPIDDDDDDDDDIKPVKKKRKDSDDEDDDDSPLPKPGKRGKTKIVDPDDDDDPEPDLDDDDEPVVKKGKKKKPVDDDDDDDLPVLKKGKKKRKDDDDDDDVDALDDDED